ncbi:MAG: cell division protein ZapA [Desulfobacterota bacterium]|nr:cell division protein ZapA [Thermodesulfobacteriota bacterium]
MSETYPITIMGQKFVLKGTFEQDYIKKVEQYINQKIDEVKKTGGTPDSYNLMILVALNLVDDCLQKEQQLSKILEVIEQQTTAIEKLIDSRL